MNKELLEELRKEFGLSQSTLAKILGLKSHSTYVYKLDNDSWTVQDLRKLCHLYGVSANDLLGLTDRQLVLIKQE